MAEEAKAVDPVVNLLQFGGWLRARVVTNDDRAHLDLFTECSDCAVQPTRQMLPAGALDLAQLTTQTISYDAEVAAGQPILHGDGPMMLHDGPTPAVDGRHDRPLVRPTADRERARVGFSGR